MKRYLILILLGVSNAWAATEVKSIDFSVDNKTQNTVIEIVGAGPLNYQAQPNAEDKQLVLDLNEVSLSSTASRPLDASSFPSIVSLVSPYAVEGAQDQARVVIQLRDWKEATVTAEGNKIRIVFPPAAGTSSPAVAESSENPETPSATMITSNNAGEEEKVAEKPKDRMDEFMKSQDKQEFKGKPITIQVRDMEVRDILRLIGEASGFNIIIADDVGGRLTLSLTDVPWDQVLDIVLRSMNLGADRNSNVLRIMPMNRLVQQKQDEQRLREASVAQAPRITKIIPVNYANPDELISTVQEFVNSRSSSGGVGDRSVVRVDRRTNSIVIQDTQEGIEKTMKLIQLLDTQTPQVLIEAKIVEARENFSKSIGGSLGFGSTAADASESYLASFAGGNPLDALISNPTGSTYTGSTFVFPTASTFASQSASASSSGGAFGTSFRTAFIPGVERINAVLAMGESESQAKIVSSPKVVVLNKEQASILQTIPVLIPTVTLSAAGSAPGVQVVQANISLSVTPQVTNDESVMMQLNISRDSPQVAAGGTSQAVSNRNISTKVLVESGTTLVIGGMYSYDTSKGSSGFPILRKIPIIGNFFGSENETTGKLELFIFITPKILNTKKSGIVTT